MLLAHFLILFQYVENSEHISSSIERIFSNLGVKQLKNITQWLYYGNPEIMYIFKISQCCRHWTLGCRSSQWEPSPVAFCLFLLKGTHARDFHILFLNFILHLSLTNRYKTQYGQHFRKNSLKFTQIFKVCDNSPFSPKARSMAECCRQKCNVKLSGVFVSVCFRSVLSVFGEKAESNFAFSAKAQS